MDLFCHSPLKGGFLSSTTFCLYDNRKEKLKASDLRRKAIDDDNMYFPPIFKKIFISVTEGIVSSVFFADPMVISLE